MRNSIIVCLVLILFFSACEKELVKPAETNPKAIFKQLWEAYDQLYAPLAHNKVNWDSIYTAYDSRIHDNLADDELFNLMAEMLDHFKDSHVRLKYNNRLHAYTKPLKRFYNKTVISTYLSTVGEKAMYTYGQAPNGIGYIHISTFDRMRSGFEAIVPILDKLNTQNGLILDVRANGGGSEDLAAFVAGHFYDQDYPYSYIQFRTGPNYNDLGKKRYKTCSPTEFTYLNFPIVLLTDQSVASAGEDFTLMMKVLPQVTLVGDRTAGQPGGSPIWGELANGWTYYLPTAVGYTIEEDIILNRGIMPDVSVVEEIRGWDLILEKGIQLLR